METGRTGLLSSTRKMRRACLLLCRLSVWLVLAMFQSAKRGFDDDEDGDGSRFVCLILHNFYPTVPQFLYKMYDY
jgi:hypothetical protein